MTNINAAEANGWSRLETVVLDDDDVDVDSDALNGWSALQLRQ
jgi:hypothetical protein